MRPSLDPCMSNKYKFYDLEIMKNVPLMNHTLMTIKIILNISILYDNKILSYFVYMCLYVLIEKLYHI